MNQIKPQKARNILLETILKEYLRLESGPDSKAKKLANAFIKTIEAGYWRPGDRIPNEADMAKTLPLSLGTVQNALRRLVEQGIIERRRGYGSRIADISETGWEKDWEIWFLRFIDEKSGKHLILDVISTEISETSQPGPWSEFLEQESDFIRMERLISAVGEMMILCRLYLPARRFRPLLDYDPTTFGRRHVRHILQHRFNAPTLQVKQNIRVNRLDDGVAAALQLPPGSIGLEMEAYCRTFHSEPLFYQQFFIPPSSRWINILRPEN